MHTLTVYISDDCYSCEETLRILDEVRLQFPVLEVTLVDTQREPMPEAVFAVPTYVLNGKVVSLGNPNRIVLAERLTQLFASPAPLEMEPK
jgi:glutaredoxin